MTEEVRRALTAILLKKAKGYRYTERTDEFAVADGEKKLVRSKTVTKRVHPDVNAIKALLTMSDDADVTAMTDEQLQVEKLRLIRLLGEAEQTPPAEDD